MAPQKSPIAHGQDMMKSIADALDAADKLPGSRELSMVKTKLDEAIMWGNRALMNQQEVINEAPARAVASEIMVDRTTLRLVADAVDTYLRMIERREPPPGQNPVDVIEAAVRKTFSQHGNAAVPNLRLICSEVLTARLRKEGA